MTIAACADEHSASEEYRARFAGVAGQWMLERQGSLVLKALESLPGATVLDVGGGHGQIAEPLIARGYKVTVLGSSDAALTQVRALAAAGRCETAVGNPLSMPYQNGSFDVVSCFRLLPHVPDWQHLIAELCRVARQAVLVDYPTWQSINFLAPVTFHFKKALERNTRTFTLFSHSQISRAFSASGYSQQQRYPEFFWPMVLHRIVKSRGVSEGLESVPRVLGLTATFGSPVVLLAQRALGADGTSLLPTSI